MLETSNGCMQKELHTMTSDDTTKRCTKCGKEYPETLEFFYKSGIADNLRGECKRCTYISSYKRRTNWEKKNIERNKSGVSSGQIYQKCCCDCKVTLPAIDEFWYKNSRTKDGYQTRCKQCSRLRLKEWQEKNRERVQEINRIWAKNNPEKILIKNRNWNQNNPDKKRASENKRRARKTGDNGTHTGQQIQGLYIQQNGKCFHCEIDLSSNFHEDHWIPLSRGGSNEIENIRLLCPRCNMSKGAKLPNEWDGKYLTS